MLKIVLVSRVRKLLFASCNRRFHKTPQSQFFLYSFRTIGDRSHLDIRANFTGPTHVPMLESAFFLFKIEISWLCLNLHEGITEKHKRQRRRSRRRRRKKKILKFVSSRWALIVIDIRIARTTTNLFKYPIYLKIITLTTAELVSRVMTFRRSRCQIVFNDCTFNLMTCVWLYERTVIYLKRMDT